jgi:hypothetical protein
MRAFDQPPDQVQPGSASKGGVLEPPAPLHLHCTSNCTDCTSAENPLHRTLHRLHWALHWRLHRWCQHRPFEHANARTLMVGFGY